MNGVHSDTKSNIFRAYDIRGIFNFDFDAEDSRRIAIAISQTMRPSSQIGVGRDIRPSSAEIHASVIEGLTYGKMIPVDLGVVPTPLLYYGVRNLHLSSGIMITASHLPPEWNGMKICDSGGIVQGYEDYLNKIEAKYASVTTATGQKESKPNFHAYKNSINDYVSYISDSFHFNRDLKIVFDYGNSVTSLVLPKIISKLNIYAFSINDGLLEGSPNRPSEPREDTLIELRDAVLSSNSDLGIAYDGDGDRVAFVTKSGRIIASGDFIIPIFAHDKLVENPGAKIVIDTTCSNAVTNYIRKNGGLPVISKTGHTNVVRKVMSENAVFGGQYSGHMVFPENMNSDDAIYSSMKMIEILDKYGPDYLSDFLNTLPKRVQSGMLEIPCKDSIKFWIVSQVIKKVKKLGYAYDLIDGIKVFKGDAWVLIRASNTSPIIRVKSEGDTEKEEESMLMLGESMVMEEMNGH